MISERVIKKMVKQVSIVVNDGDSFFSHETSVNFNPLQFMIDFKCITPRVDQRVQKAPTFFVKHNVVMVDPWHMIKLKEMVDKSIVAYENEFGKIVKPEGLKILEKKPVVEKDDNPPDYVR